MQQFEEKYKGSKYFAKVKALVESLPKSINHEFPPEFAEEAMVHIMHLNNMHKERNVNVFREMESDYSYIGLNDDQIAKVIVTRVIEDINDDCIDFVIEAVSAMKDKRLMVFVDLLTH